MDDQARTFGAALDLWPVAREGFDPAGLVFEGAVEPIALEAPNAVREGDGLAHQRRRAEGVFRHGATREDLFARTRELGIALHHTTRDRSRLLPLPDEAGMALEDGDAFGARVRGAAGRPPAPVGEGRRISGGGVGESVAAVPTLGDPACPEPSLAFSRNDVGVGLRAAGFAPGPALRALAPPGLGAPLAAPALAAAVAWRGSADGDAPAPRPTLAAAVLLALGGGALRLRSRAGSPRRRWRGCSGASRRPGGSGSGRRPSRCRRRWCGAPSSAGAGAARRR